MPVTIVRKTTRQALNRGLVFGGPNSGKTSLLLTMSNEKVTFLNMPDEKGTKTVPQTENIDYYSLEYESLSNSAPASEWLQLSLDKYNSTLNLTREILSVQREPGEILFLDGLSKLAEVALAISTGGIYAKDGTVPRPREQFKPSYTLVENYLTEIYMSRAFSTVICTAWQKLDDPDQNSSEDETKSKVKLGRRQWFPNFPGQLGLTIAGSFDWCIHAGTAMGVDCTQCKDQNTIGMKLHPVYQLLPWDDVQCVGVKGKAIDKTFIHQNWQVLKKLVS